MPTIPPKTLTAIGSNRKITLPKTGRATLLIFHGRETAEAARVVNDAVRRRQPDAAQLLVASVVDLHIVPRLMRGLAERMIRQGYQDGSKELPENMPAPEYLIILPDWDGLLTKAAGMRDTEKSAGLALLDHEGVLLGTQQGGDLAQAALTLLDKAGL